MVDFPILSCVWLAMFVLLGQLFIEALNAITLSDSWVSVCPLKLCMSATFMLNLAQAEVLHTEMWRFMHQETPCTSLMEHIPHEIAQH